MGLSSFCTYFFSLPLVSLGRPDLEGRGGEGRGARVGSVPDRRERRVGRKKKKERGGAVYCVALESMGVRIRYWTSPFGACAGCKSQVWVCSECWERQKEAGTRSRQRPTADDRRESATTGTVGRVCLVWRGLRKWQVGLDLFFFFSLSFRCLSSLLLLLVRVAATRCQLNQQMRPQPE